MPRAKKNVHGSPATAGAKNMPDDFVNGHKDELNTMGKLLPAYNIGQKNRQDYKGQYDEESLTRVIGEFFQYCKDTDAKPSKFGLQIWLGICRQTYNEWQSKPEKYGFKSDILRQANDFIAWTYEMRVEQYPTGNIFLLKARHDVVETTKVEVSNANSVKPDEIGDAVSRLGLDSEQED